MNYFSNVPNFLRDIITVSNKNLFNFTFVASKYTLIIIIINFCKKIINTYLMETQFVKHAAGQVSFAMAEDD